MYGYPFDRSLSLCKPADLAAVLADQEVPRPFVVVVKGEIHGWYRTIDAAGNGCALAAMEYGAREWKLTGALFDLRDPLTLDIFTDYSKRD